MLGKGYNSMAQDTNHKDTAAQKAADREYVYLRYEDAEDELDIYDMIGLCKKGLLILKRYIVLLLVFLLVGGGLGYLRGKTAQPSYTSTALLFLDLNSDRDTSDTSETDRISMLASSFTEIVKSESVIAPVAKSCDLSAAALRGSIATKIPDKTQLISVTVTAGDAASAQALCAGVVDAGTTAFYSAVDYATITVISPASEGAVSGTGGAVKSAAVFGAVFLLLAVLIVAVRELLLTYKFREAAKANH